jgi:catechol 2,3-dioxygenase-like lactoylglutathione lyase family enzyme
MKVHSLDHLVLTVRDLEATIAFYVRDPDGNLVELATPL